MRVFTITKKGLLSIFFCILISVFAIMVTTRTATLAVQTLTQEREIPIYYVETDKKVCSISFDAAWGNEQTETLLDILDEHDVKTTFFLVGDWVESYPQSVKEIALRGHDVGNHSDTHAHMSELSKEEQIDEIISCNDKIKAITNKDVTLFRPPYGEYDNKLVINCKEQQMYCTQWNIDSLDWKDPTAEQITKNVVDKIKNGSIILLHNGAKNTPEALPMIIEGIRAKGFEIVPISQILLKGEYYTDHEGRMHLKESD